MKYDNYKLKQVSFSNRLAPSRPLRSPSIIDREASFNEVGQRPNERRSDERSFKGRFTLPKIFWHGSDKNGSCTKKNGSARMNFAV